MEDAINSTNMGQEVVSKPLSFMSASNKTSNVMNFQESRNLRDNHNGRKVSFEKHKHSKIQQVNRPQPLACTVGRASRTSRRGG